MAHWQGWLWSASWWVGIRFVLRLQRDDRQLFLVRFNFIPQLLCPRLSFTHWPYAINSFVCWWDKERLWKPEAKYFRFTVAIYEILPQFRWRQTYGHRGRSRGIITRAPEAQEETINALDWRLKELLFMRSRILCPGIWKGLSWRILGTARR